MVCDATLRDEMERMRLLKQMWAMPRQARAAQLAPRSGALWPPQLNPRQTHLARLRQTAFFLIFTPALRSGAVCRRRIRLRGCRFAERVHRRGRGLRGG